jgi:MSHA pilin protein MshD
MMRPTRHPSARGFTLIELEVLIVIVSVSLAGVMLALNAAVQSSADPLVRKQMLTIAEGMMSEILSKAYDDPYNDCTPTTVPACRNDSEANRISDRKNYNDVSDYAGYATSGIYRIDGTPAAGLENYNIDAIVIDDSATLGTIGGAAIACGSGTLLPIKRITITVGHDLDSLSLSGYRTCYDRI